MLTYFEILNIINFFFRIIIIHNYTVNLDKYSYIRLHLPLFSRIHARKHRYFVNRHTFILHQLNAFKIIRHNLFSSIIQKKTFYGSSLPLIAKINRNTNKYVEQGKTQLTKLKIHSQHLA